MRENDAVNLLLFLVQTFDVRPSRYFYTTGQTAITFQH